MNERETVNFFVNIRRRNSSFNFNVHVAHFTINCPITINPFADNIFWVAAIFLLPVSPLRLPFLPCFARTAQQPILDGTN